MAVAVAIDGVMVWADEVGYADLAKQIRVTSETRFRIGSVSKPIAAAGLALLVERGRLDLDAPIQTYIPDYPKTSLPITVRLLAGHLSGIRDYRKGEALSNIAYPDARSRLKIFEDDPLENLPGTTFKYAGYNWNVIEVAIERAAGQRFDAYIEANVLQPLHLTDTRAEQPDPADAQRAQFYEVDDAGAFVMGPPIDVRHAWAVGGYLSTAKDLVRFGSALLRPGYLKESSRRALFTSQTTSDGKSTGYGMGWSIYSQPKVIFHSGWTVGGLSILLMLPESNTVVAVVTNRGSLNVPENHRLYFNIEEIGYKIARIFGESGR
jgi:CubicO group peptidase (beta-lactamase class C family)